FRAGGRAEFGDEEHEIRDDQAPGHDRPVRQLEWVVVVERHDHRRTSIHRLLAPRDLRGPVLLMRVVMNPGLREDARNGSRHRFWPGTHSTSVAPLPFMKRAATNRKSESRLTYLSAAGETPSADLSLSSTIILSA